MAPSSRTDFFGSDGARSRANVTRESAKSANTHKSSVHDLETRQIFCEGGVAGAKLHQHKGLGTFRPASNWIRAGRAMPPQHSGLPSYHSWTHSVVRGQSGGGTVFRGHNIIRDSVPGAESSGGAVPWGRTNTRQGGVVVRGYSAREA